MVWFCVFLALVVVWLFKWNGFYQVASIVFFFSFVRLVGPPAEFPELCDRYAGTKVFRTEKNVSEISYFSAFLPRPRAGELDLPLPVIDAALLADGSASNRFIPLSPVRYSSVARLLMHYDYVESFADPQTGHPSFVTEPGFYRFSRLRLPENVAECAAIESAYAFPLQEDIESFRARGRLPADFCVRADPLNKISARWEYINELNSLGLFTYRTLISHGRISARRRVVHDRVSGEMLALNTTFHWWDSVGGGWPDKGLDCGVDSAFPQPQDILLPLNTDAN